MVQQASRLAPGEQQDEKACRHHWIIEAPKGPVSMGVCRLCSEAREFKNYIGAAPCGEDGSTTQPDGRYPVGSSTDDMEDPEAA